MKILLVEDDEGIVEILREALTTQHYLVNVANDGQIGLEMALTFAYDLILLNLMLPKVDGISFCRQLRAQKNSTPILLLTAQDTSINKVTALDAGADDYVIKPFEKEELLARIRALLRRGTSNFTTPVMQLGKLRLDPNNCEVTYDEQLLQLTSKEYALLELFLRRSHRIFSQSALIDLLWSFEEPPSETTVRSHIKSLRQKLKKAGAADLIETVYGLGYRLKSKEMELKNQEAPTTMIPERSQQQVPPELAAIWERVKEKYNARIMILEQALTALLEGTLSQELRKKAAIEAHTLVGSLGSFGFVEASRKSREIEQIFQSEESSIRHLSELVMALRQELGQPPVILRSQTPQPTIIKQQPRLLIVDDDAELALALISEATAWGMQVEVAYDLSQAREVIGRVRPDVVLLDLCFPDSAEKGFGLLAELVTDRPPIPVVVFTAQESFPDRVKAARLGGRGFLQKPIRPDEVINALVQILQQSSKPDAKLLIVDDDLQVLDFMRSLLEAWGFKLTLLDDPQQFWDTLEQTAPDLLILDADMPLVSGIELCQVVRNDPRWSGLPVLVLSTHTDAEMVHWVFTAGADDYVNKPIVGPELIARILNRLERTQILTRLTAREK
ncbi:MAG: response regulator [Chamaesiphon sp.]